MDGAATGSPAGAGCAPCIVTSWRRAPAAVLAGFADCTLPLRADSDRGAGDRGGACEGAGPGDRLSPVRVRPVEAGAAAVAAPPERAERTRAVAGGVRVP